jgi:hypothetical protein
MVVLVIEPHYIPNLRYFSKFLNSNRIIIDDTSLFRKQSYRNRANILTANGVQSIIVPVCKGRSKTIFKEIKIDNSSHWQKNHWNAIISSYNKSAYFQFYKHLFEIHFDKQYNFLIDLNLDVINTITTILKLQTEIRLLSEIKNEEIVFTDFRDCIDPKPRYNKADPLFNQITYSQVFSDRFEFIPDLSIIDLMFNRGTDTLEILQKSANLLF